MDFDNIKTVGPSDKSDANFYNENRTESLRAALKEVPRKGDFLEFGVYTGGTATEILKKVPNRSKLHLFDSFEGLPEDWTFKCLAGAFKLEEENIPTFKSKKVKIHKGWFEDTVGTFSKAESTLAFVHIDCDLYSSTKTVLDAIGSRIRKGTIVLFDEYMGYAGWEDHEHKAFTEFIESTGKEFEYVHKSNYSQLCVRFL